MAPNRGIVGASPLLGALAPDQLRPHYWVPSPLTSCATELLGPHLIYIYPLDHCGPIWNNSSHLATDPFWKERRTAILLACASGVRDDNGAAPECKGGRNGRSRRKPADQRYHPARFPLEKKSGSDPAGDRTRFALVGGEQSSRSATAAPLVAESVIDQALLRALTEHPTLHLLYCNTDSLLYETACHHVYKAIARGLKAWFDTSNYASDNLQGFQLVNKGITGVMKDECADLISTHFVGLRPKLYTYIDTNEQCMSKAKDVKPNMLQSLHYQDYWECLERNPRALGIQFQLCLCAHRIYTEHMTKVALSSMDDKCFVELDGMLTLPWGHYRIVTSIFLSLTHQLSPTTPMSQLQNISMTQPSSIIASSQNRTKDLPPSEASHLPAGLCDHISICLSSPSACEVAWLRGVFKSMTAVLESRRATNAHGPNELAARLSSHLLALSQHATASRTTKTQCLRATDFRAQSLDDLRPSSVVRQRAKKQHRLSPHPPSELIPSPDTYQNGPTLLLPTPTTLTLHQSIPSPDTEQDESHPPSDDLESCRMIPLVGGFSRGFPISPALSFWHCSIHTSFTLIGSQNLDIKSHPNLFTLHSTLLLPTPPSPHQPSELIPPTDSNQDGLTLLFPLPYPSPTTRPQLLAEGICDALLSGQRGRGWGCKLVGRRPSRSRSRHAPRGITLHLVARTAGGGGLRRPGERWWAEPRAPACVPSLGGGASLRGPDTCPAPCRLPERRAAPA
ncbi:hypothetical protein PR048_003321 [Dryococelus australis]|uniref:Uncharacterized protein n=1 Tax=Dryococelus australis TaxID=614101 RepID=A0ABQ9IMP3_9NEOP|nr:hypothetical protein PR048_003321 [Dryococelus australis]